MKRKYHVLLAAVLGIALSCTAAGCRAQPVATEVETSTRSPTHAQTAVIVEPEPTEDAPSPEPEATATAPAPSPEPEVADASWRDREAYQSGLIEDAQDILDGLDGATVYHIEMRILDDLMHIEGRETVYYTNREGVPLDALYFRLFPNVAGGAATVSEITVDGQAIEPALEFDESALRAPLPEPLQPGEMAVLELDFAVTIPSELGGQFGLFGFTEGILALDEFYPHIPVYDDEGWNVELPDGIGDSTYLDASFYRVTVEAPENLTLVASGVTLEDATSGGYQSVTFAAGPARDFYLAASERFERVSATVGGTKVHSYAFREYAESSEFVLRIAAASLAGFNARLGKYPYAELDLISVPMNAGGIEYPGAIGLALQLYDVDAEVSGLPSRVFLESATAHEVAHQWFYNTVGNDQIDDPWLDEAVVQYVTWTYYVDLYGERAAQGYRNSWVRSWDRVAQEEIPIGMPARNYEPYEYGPIVYGRGPLFVEALAEEMGPEIFDTFLRDYYQTYLWSIGTPEGFRSLAEEHCDCDLDALFQDWVYGP